MTGGNPFFVTEVLGAGGSGDPADRPRRGARARGAADGGGARAARRGRGRAGRGRAVAARRGRGPDASTVDECLTSGMLRADRDVARLPARARAARGRGVDRARPPARAAPRDPGGAGRRRRAASRTLARLAHHAEAAGDARAVLRYAPAAAERAALLDAHREAAAQYGRALRFADALPPEQRAELLELRSDECFICRAARGGARGAQELARDQPRARRSAPRGRRPALLSRLALVRRPATGGRARPRWPPSTCSSASPAAASSRWRTATSRSCGCIARRRRRRASSGATRAIELAERSASPQPLAHALNSVGFVEFRAGSDDGAGEARAQPRDRLEHGFHESGHRAFINLAAAGVDRRLVRALPEDWIQQGLDFLRGAQRRLVAGLPAAACVRGSSSSRVGWSEATDAAEHVLAARALPLARVIALVRARPGPRAARRSRGGRRRSTRRCARLGRERAPADRRRRDGARGGGAAGRRVVRRARPDRRRVRARAGPRRRHPGAASWRCLRRRAGIEDELPRARSRSRSRSSSPASGSVPPSAGASWRARTRRRSRCSRSTTRARSGGRSPSSTGSRPGRRPRSRRAGCASGACACRAARTRARARTPPA